MNFNFLFCLKSPFSTMVGKCSVFVCYKHFFRLSLDSQEASDFHPLGFCFFNVTQTMPKVKTQNEIELGDKNAGAVQFYTPQVFSPGKLLRDTIKTSRQEVDFFFTTHMFTRESEDRCYRSFLHHHGKAFLQQKQVLLHDFWCKRPPGSFLPEAFLHQKQNIFTPDAFYKRSPSMKTQQNRYIQPNPRAQSAKTKQNRHIQPNPGAQRAKRLRAFNTILVLETQC